MKILFLSDDFPPHAQGGAGVIAYALAKEFAARGHEVAVITATQSPKEEGAVFFKEGFLVHSVFSDYHVRWRAYVSLYNPAVVKKIKKIIFETKPDAVHAHNVHWHLSYHALRIAKKSGAKVLLTAHDVMSYAYGKVDDESKISPVRDLQKYRLRYNPFRNLLIRHYLKNVDGVIAVSRALKRALQNNGIQNVGVIHNGIDLEDWVASVEQINNFKKKYWLENKKVVLFGGRLSEAKGGGNMVKAMIVLAKKNPHAVLLVAGSEDGYARAMKEIAETERIRDCLVFTGWLGRDEMKAAYFSCDVAVVPSLCFDSFPNANLEAMATKKPVVGTCFGGTPEIVIDGETGYLVDPRRIDVFADKISDLLNDERKANQFGQEGYERVKNEFSLQRQADEYLRAYCSVI